MYVRMEKNKMVLCCLNRSQTKQKRDSGCKIRIKNKKCSQLSFVGGSNNGNNAHFNNNIRIKEEVEKKYIKCVESTVSLVVAYRHVEH